jgi:hypothetical protein
MGEIKRIWWKKLDSSGKFPDGRIKQDVYFTDDSGKEYTWTAPWEKVKELYLNAFRVEKINKPQSSWLKEFEDVARTAWDEEIESFSTIEGLIGGLEESKLKILVPVYKRRERIDVFSILDTPDHYEKYLCPLSFKPSLKWLKDHQNKWARFTIVNGYVKDIELKSES